MAYYDWNRNGRNDMTDDYMEYNICKSSFEEDYSGRNGNVSWFKTLLSVFSGLLIQSLIYTVFQVDVEDVPLILIIVLWIGFSAVVTHVMDCLNL